MTDSNCKSPEPQALSAAVSTVLWAVPRLSIIQPRTYSVQFRYEF